jgi:hypothetical protein
MLVKQILLQTNPHVQETQCCGFIYLHLLVEINMFLNVCFLKSNSVHPSK